MRWFASQGQSKVDEALRNRTQYRRRRTGSLTSTDAMKGQGIDRVRGVIWGQMCTHLGRENPQVVWHLGTRPEHSTGPHLDRTCALSAHVSSLSNDPFTYNTASKSGLFTQELERKAAPYNFLQNVFLPCFPRTWLNIQHRVHRVPLKLPSISLKSKQFRINKVMVKADVYVC